MIHGRPIAQVVCGIVAGAGVAIGGTAGLVLAHGMYDRGTRADPVNVAEAPRPVPRPGLMAAVGAADAERGVDPPAAKAHTRSAKRTSRAPKRSRPHRRARPAKRRVVPKSAVAQVRPQAPAPAPAPTRPAPVVRRRPAPVAPTPAPAAPAPAPAPRPTTPAPKPSAPARKAPAPAPAAEPASSSTFDDSG